MHLKGFFFIVKDFLRLVFNWAYGGGSCIVCGNSTVKGDICSVCRNNLLLKSTEIKSSGRCSVCGKILLSEKDICMACRNERILLSCSRVYPVFSYRLWGKTLMFHWKMLEKRGISAFIARIFYNVLKTEFKNEGNIIVPVPPRPGKIRKKGWDQMDDVCTLLECRYNYKIERLLKRKGSVQQKKLDRKQRLDDSEERYALSKKGINIKRENLPECVILIDDVMTTGSTVECCAKLLKSIGIRKVNVLTLFIVD